MSSVEYLREFVNERLTAAAEEIFRAFNKTIFEYEEEIDRQRKLLDIVWKPEIKLHRIELPQQHVCKEEEVLADQQLCIQERNSSLDQEDPEPPQIKEEQEELCTSQEGEQLELKQETETFILTPTDEESDHSEDQILYFNPDKSQSVAETELPASMCISWLKNESDWENPEVSEPNSDHQLLSHNSHVAEGQDQKGGFMLTSIDEERDHKDQTKDLNADKTLETESVVNMPVISALVSEAHSEKLLSQKGGKNGDSGSTSNAEPKLKKIRHKSNSQTNNVNNFTMSTIHCNTSMDKKLFQCDTCGKAFKHKSSLDRHMRTHTGEKPYSCNTFGEKLKKGHHKMKRPSNDVNNFTMLKIHRTTPTGLEKKSLKCDVCGKGFKYNSKLQRHLLIHTDEKPHSCKTCGKEFRCSSHLTGHMRTHTGEKPYLCKSCGKRFGDISSLNRHMRIHTGEKPHTCKICGQNFRRNSCLLVHMRRAHTGEKPYRCKICGKKFFDAGVLSSHKRYLHCNENSVNFPK